MNTTFEKLYRQLGLGTIAVLIIGLVFLVLALSSALLGFQRPAAGFSDASSLFGYVFMVLIALFLITSLVAVFLRWHDRGALNTSFNFFHRQLGRGTVAVLMMGLGCLGLALLFALLGLPDVVAGFNRATISIARVFVVLLGLFLISSLIGAFIRWLDRRYGKSGRSEPR